MIVKGNIVASSHLFRLKFPGNSLILKFITEEGCIDVLVKDEGHFHWNKEITNGDVYKLTGLKTCILTMGKSEVSMLMTTKESLLEKINCNTILTKDNYLLEDKSLITYHGFVTKIMDPNFCIYELDKNIMLCTIYLKSVAHIPTLSVGDNVFIERTHLIQSTKERALLCCGLSSIKLTTTEKAKTEDVTVLMLSNLVSCLGIGYMSLKTLQDILLQLNTKLCPTLLSYKRLLSCEKYQNSISMNNGLLAVLLSCSHLIEKSYLTTEFTYSALNEFVSCPHVCLSMRNVCLPKDLHLPLMESILVEAKKSTFTSFKTWKYSQLSLTPKTKKILVGCLTCTEDGSLYLHDQSSAIPCTIIKSNHETPDDFNKNLCPVSHKDQDYIINYLVALSSFDVITEMTLGAESIPSTYILVKSSDIIPLTKRETIIKTSSKEDLSKETEIITFNLCQVFLFKNKILPVLSDKEWKNQFLVEAISVSNVVVEIDCDVSDAAKNLDNLEFDDFFAADEASSLPTFMERRRKDILVTNESLSLYPYFETGKAELLKIPFTLEVTNNVSEDVNLMIRKFVNMNPLVLPKGTIIRPYGRVIDICPQHSLTSISQDSKIKLVKDTCFCSLITKHHSVEEVSTHGEIYSPFDSIDVEGFVKEKWIVKNKEIKTEMDPPLQISLVLTDKENPVVSMNVYIGQSHPEWTLYGLLPGRFVQLNGVKVLKYQNGTYYLKSAKKFGLELIESNAALETNFWNVVRSVNVATPSPLTYFIHINNNQQFRSLSTIIRVLSVEILECARSSNSQVVPAKAKFIFDDGSLQVTAHCTGVSVKHLLNISEQQWQDLISIASSEPRGLNFNWWNKKHMDNETNPRVTLFHYMCNRGDIRRQVIANCRAYASSREADSLSKGQFRVFCISIEDVQPIDVSVEILRLLRK